MQYIILLVLFLGLTSCDGYWLVKKDVEYQGQISNSCIEHSFQTIFPNCKLSSPDNKNVRTFSWKSKEGGFFRGDFGVLNNHIEINVGGVTAWFPGIHDKEVAAAKEVDKLVVALQKDCGVTAVTR